MNRKIVMMCCMSLMACGQIVWTANARPTEVLFTFDTEDFTNPRSADAVKELAELFTSERVTAHFVTVGYMARSLVQRGRFDVIEAMKPHLKLTHTLMHSIHPNTSEASDVADLEDAFKVVRPKEQRGGFGPFPALEKMSLKGEWLFSEDFEDKYVSETIRNQIWTLRYE